MKYFKYNFQEGLLPLYGAKIVLMIASGFLGIFLPIFLFDLFRGDVKLVALYFGLASFLYIFAVPFGARFLNNFGFRNALRFSVFWGALFYVIFYFINSENAIYLIPLSIVVIVLYRVFYWVPYHTDFTKFTGDQDRAKELSMFRITRNILTGLIPILSGFLLVRFGFDLIFVIAIILYLTSALFYIKLPRTKEKFGWSYSQSWSKLFSKKNRSLVLPFFSDGVENLIGVIIWPIFIYQLLDGDYFKVGYVSALIIVITVILQFLLGESLDKKGNKRSVLKTGTLFYSAGWLIKMFVVTASHIFVVGVYHNLVKIFSRTSFDVMTYDLAATQGHYVDEFTVLHEMAFHSGKALAAVLVILLSFILPLQWTFLLAAVASIVMNMLRNRAL